MVDHPAARGGDVTTVPTSTLATLARARMGHRPPAHDWSHVARVMKLADMIARAEGAEGAEIEIVTSAAALHELVNLPKDHPDSANSGELCAVEAGALMREAGVDVATSARIAACIRDHAFSKGVVAASLEGRIVQDADRLDAIGAIGIARLFATTSEMRRPFYADVDPLCVARAPNDKLWGVDHFFRKLLKIEAGLHTETARRLAVERVAAMRAFLAQLEREIA